MALPVRRSNDDRAELARWDPFSELERFHRQLANYLDSWRQFPDLLGGGFTPLADVEETPDAYLVEIELPGVKRDDIDIEIAAGASRSAANARRRSAWGSCAGVSAPSVVCPMR
jgi:HSP20 family protein